MRAHIALLIVFFNMTSFRASKVLVTLFGIELGAAQFFIGILVATYSVFPMLLAIYAGKLSDRLGVRTPMLCGSVGMSGALALPFVYPHMPALYASAALLGVSHVFYNVSMQNLIGGLGGPDDRTRNFNNYSLVMALGSFVGPLVAGFLIDLTGHARSYLVFALVPLVSIALIAAARGIGRPRVADATSAEHVAHGQGLLASAPLRRTLITSAVVLTGIDLFQFYMPIYGHHVGLSASAIGVILSMFAVAAFVIRIALPSMARRWGEERLLTWSLFAGAATYVLFPFFDSLFALALVAFCLGLSLGLGQPLSLMLIYAASPAARTGEALGLRMTINNFTHIVVPVAFGALGTALGVAPVFVANALMLAGGGALIRRGPQ